MFQKEACFCNGWRARRKKNFCDRSTISERLQHGAASPRDARLPASQNEAFLRRNVCSGKGGRLGFGKPLTCIESVSVGAREAAAKKAVLES
jgi:hypothetical protein